MQTGPIKVERLEVIHNGEGKDGYPTYVKVDGKIGPDMNPPRRDKRIKVFSDASWPVRVEVEWLDGTVTIYEPEYFEMKLPAIEVRTHPQRNPCQITIYGIEPYVRSFSVDFIEGVAPLVDVRILPKAKEADEPHIVERNG